jgi:hypothetical protein
MFWIFKSNSDIAPSNGGRASVTRDKTRTMKNSIKLELKGYVFDLIDEGVLTEENRDDWHFFAFNESPYLIGIYECKGWLALHGIDIFEAIRICQEYEMDNFGQIYKPYDNAETLVNMLVYIYGEEVIAEVEFEKEYE